MSRFISHFIWDEKKKIVGMFPIRNDENYEECVK